MPINNFDIVETPELSGCLYRSGQPDGQGVRTFALLGLHQRYRLNQDGPLSVDQERALATYQLDFAEVGWAAGAQLGLDRLVPQRDAVAQLVGQIHGDVRTGQHVAIGCHYGKDGTGLIVAAFQIMVLGMALDEAMRRREAYGTSALGDATYDHAIAELLQSLSRTVTT